MTSTANFGFSHRFTEPFLQLTLGKLSDTLTSELSGAEPHFAGSADPQNIP